MTVYNEGSVYRICNKNVGNPHKDPSVQDAFDECVEEVTQNIADKTAAPEKNNEYAICTISVGREDEAKYKRCKEQVKKSSRNRREGRMSSQLKSAIRTARSLMAEGLLGEDLWQGIKHAHPTITPSNQDRLAALLRKEVGFLGHVAHDPNQYPSCKTARLAKERHPRKEGLILTYRTPMCGSF